MRTPILAAFLILGAGCATQPSHDDTNLFRGSTPPPYAPVVNDAVARYHRCLGYEMGGFLETGGNAQSMIDSTLERCDVELRRLNSDLFAQDVTADERATVLAQAEEEARNMLQRHLQEVLSEQS